MAIYKCDLADPIYAATLVSWLPTAFRFSMVEVSHLSHFGFLTFEAQKGLILLVTPLTHYLISRPFTCWRACYTAGIACYQWVMGEVVWTLYYL
jgi:hypothetical protein